MLQLTSLSNIKLPSGRTFTDIEVTKIPSVDSEYVVLKTQTGWQAQYVRENGKRIAVAVDCYSKDVALDACKKDHIERLKAEIKRLEDIVGG